MNPRTNTRHPAVRHGVRCFLLTAIAALGLSSCIFDSEPANHPPVIRSFSINPTPVLEDSSSTISVVAEDRDGDRLTFLWSATCGTFPQGMGGGSVLWKAPGTAGVCSLEVMVGDGDEQVRGIFPVQVVVPQPLVSASPETLDFSGTLTSWNLRITNVGSGVLSWTLSWDEAWLAADPASGTTGGETDLVEVTVDRTALGIGLYEGEVRVDSDGGADTVRVIMEVPPEPLVVVTPLELDFGDSTTQMTFAIWNMGTGALHWSITEDIAWADADPDTGSTMTEADLIAVTVDRYRMPLGVHNALLSISSDGGGETVTATMAVPPTPTYTYQVVNTYPHDSMAFTQGLVFENGFLYEGTGLYGRSSVRKVELETGDTLDVHHLRGDLFGEGITIWEDKIIQLTWRAGIGYVYNIDGFDELQSFSYPTEGWGITHDGEHLIMSYGTETLRFWDAATFSEVGRVDVYDLDRRVPNLNELEYIGGEVFANVWQTDRIARIDPETGRVTGWIDLTGIIAKRDVLNGIAYDGSGDRLFVTGKLWEWLFEIDLVPSR